MQIKENIKTPHHWPLFHLMTSSCRMWVSTTKSDVMWSHHITHILNFMRAVCLAWIIWGHFMSEIHRKCRGRRFLIVIMFESKWHLQTTLANIFQNDMHVSWMRIHRNIFLRAQWSRIGTGYSFVANKPQAIIWTSDGLIHWGMHAIRPSWIW